MNFFAINRLFTNKKKKENSEIFHGMDDLLRTALKFLPTGLEIIPEAKYSDVIKWFVEQPRSSKCKRGIIYRTPHLQGTIIAQFFVDDNNELICHNDKSPQSRQFITKKLDEELIDAFGDGQLIIVE